jgi:hypothetical protein
MQIVRAVTQPDAIITTDIRNDPILRDDVPHTQILSRHPQSQRLACPGLQRARLLKVAELQDRRVDC